MATRRTNEGEQINDIPSEDSFTPSETSEKYADLGSMSPTDSEKQKSRRALLRKNSDKNSSGSSFSSTTSDHSGKLKQISEGIQTEHLGQDDIVPHKDDENISDDEEQVLIPKRHVLLLMIFLGFINIYAMRVNLNVAIVAMVNNKTVILTNGLVKKYVSAVIRITYNPLPLRASFKEF